MELSDLEKVRFEKINALRAMGVEPYPTRANPTHSAGRGGHAGRAAALDAGDGQDHFCAH